MSKFNLGIIGAGMIGDVHIETARKDGRADVSWIAARTHATLNKKKTKYNIENATLDYHDILNDPAVDAVVIATPPFTHASMLVEALEAGKHVMLEKPMAIHPDEIDKIEQAVAAHPKLIVVECSCRHARLQPKFTMIKQMIDDGRLGEVYHIHHNHLMRSTFIEYNPAGSWALDKAQAGGGPFLDWGVYDLSFHLGLLNDEPQLTGIKSFTRSGLKHFSDPSIKQNIEEHGAAFMEFNTGLTYYYERGSGVHCDAANETRIYGTKGCLRFAFCSWDPAEIEFFGLDKKGNEINEKLLVPIPEEHDDSQEFMKHFLDCVIDGAEPQMTVSLAGKHLRILFQILDIH